MPSFDLIMQGEDQRSARFDGASVSIGRDPGADIVLDHPTVSRQHALIVANPRGYTLVVMSQTALTAINGNAVQGTVDLHDGNLLNFGQLAFVFRSDHGMSHTAPLQAVDAFGATSAMPPAGVDHEARTMGIPIGSAPALGLGMPQAPQAPVVTKPDDNMMGRPSQHGVLSWDDIAKQAAENDSGAAAEQSNYEKLQEAAARAEAQSGGNKLVPIAVIAILGLLGFIMFYDDSSDKPFVEPPPPEEQVAIRYAPNDLSCQDSSCVELARKQMAVGQANLDKKAADIGNTFRAFLAYDQAKKYLEKSNVKDIPADFADLDDKHASTKNELDAKIREYKRRVHQARQRKQWDDLVIVIQEARAHFPDARSWGYRWADDREMWMKEQGVFPKKKR